MRNYFGFVIILLGVGFLLQQFNISWADNVMGLWWPLSIIAVGLLAWRGNRRHVFGPMIIVLVGIIMLIDQTNLFNRSAWNIFWPIVIVLLGARVLFGKDFGHRGMQQETGDADANVLFSGVDRKVTGTFDKGSISAWFGGAKLDLRDAQFADQATLNVSLGFGGLEVWVPKHVRIVTKVTPVLGGVEDKTQQDPQATKTLTITGSAMCGGVSVKN